MIRPIVGLLIYVLVTMAATNSAFCAQGDRQLKYLLKPGLALGYPGMAMLVQKGDGRIRTAAVGYASLERRRLLRVDDRFHLASVNKTLTAVSILRLVDAGRLNLASTLSSQLGDIVARIPNADKITVGQLLDHSSGIYATNNDPDYLATLIGAKADPRKVWTPVELIALADKDRQPPLGAPGSGHYYSDTNYVLLGMIVEKVSGRSLRQYVTQTIFQPLRMTSTFFYNDYLATGAPLPPPRTVDGYLCDTADIRAVISINPMFKPVPGGRCRDGVLRNTTLAAERIDAAGGVVSNLLDMWRFASALYRGRLLTPANQKWLMSVADGMETEPTDKHRTRALQAMHKPYGVLVYKEGDGAGGVNTLMAYLPAKDEIYIGFANSFGHFDEVDFMMDEVIEPVTSGGRPRRPQKP